MNAKTWHAVRFDPTQKPEPGTCEVDYGHPLAQGLTGFWPFNEGAGRLASNLAGPGSASISGAVWQDTDRGRCLNFNGSSDYVQTPSMRVPRGDRTFAAWVRMTAAGNFPEVISDTSFCELRCNGGSRQPEWNSAEGAVTIASPFAIALNTWHLLCGITAGARAAIYADGRSVASISSATPPPVSTGVVRIGSRTTANLFFAGNIDGPMIYQRGLMASEVNWLYAEPYAMLKPVSRVTHSIPSSGTSGGPFRSRILQSSIIRAA